MVKRKLMALLLALGACKTPAPPPPPPSPPPPVAETIEQALARGDRALAFDIAWLENNNRERAAKLLEETKEPTPKLLLRKALLDFAELRERSAQNALLELIATAPQPQASEAALILLIDMGIARLDQRRAAQKALERSGLLDQDPRSPRLVTLASALAARLTGDEKLLARGGWLTGLRSTGPLGPMDDLALREHAMGTPKRTRPAAQRTLPRGMRNPPITAGDIGGIYKLQTCFDLGKTPKPVVLESHLPSAAYVHIDGVLVQQRRLNHHRDSALHRSELSLSHGWHCLQATVAAYSYQRPSFSLLSKTGAVVVLERAEAPPPSAQPKVLAHEPLPAHADEPSGLMETLLEATLALSSWRDDLDRAQALLHPLHSAASRSAVVHAAWARMQIRSGLPGSLIQASLKRALELDPSYPSALLALGRALKNDAPEEALKIAERAIESAPSSPHPHLLRFFLLKSRGWSAEAHQSLQEALERKAPRRAYLDGARFYDRQERTAQAKALQTAAQQRFFEPPDAAADRALDRGDLERALAAMKQPVLNPARHWARAAALQLTRGRVEDALRMARKALEHDPLSAEALRKLLLAQLAAQSLEDARATLQKLRARGESTLLQEALVAQSRALVPWSSSPWLEKTLRFDPAPYIGYVPGTKTPRGQDPADRWSRDQSVMVLDRVVDEVLPDGRALSYRHSINRLQTKEAADRAGELNLPPAALPLQLRTLKPDGRSFQVDQHEGKADLSFAGLQPGDAVERRWLMIDAPASPYGGYLRRFYFKSTAPLIRSELVVIVPKGTPVWSRSYNGAPEAQVHHDETRSYYLWRADQVSGFVPEPAAVQAEEYLPFVAVAVDLDQQDALLTNTMSLDRQAQSSWLVRQTAKRLTQGLKTERERIDRLFFWVTEEIGLGGPAEPDKVLATKRGERSGLFVAMLRALKIDAHLALARPLSATLIAQDYPHTGRYHLPLVRLPGRWAHLDSTSPWIGKLPPYLRSGRYLLHEPRDKIRPRPFLSQDVDSWTLESRADLQIDPQGTAKGRLKLKLPGTFGSELRTFLEQARQEDVERHFQGWIAAVLPGARLESFSSEKAPDALTILATVTIAQFMTREGDNLIAESLFDAPLAGSSLGLPSLASYIRVPQRKSPLLLQELNERMTITLKLPEQTTAPVEQPKSFRHLTRQGTFVQGFFWDAQTKEAKLIREERIPAMRIAPKDYAPFRMMAQEVLQSTRNRLVVELSL